MLTEQACAALKLRVNSNLEGEGTERHWEVRNSYEFSLIWEYLGYCW